ncbi:MAG: hypothetical protein ACYTE8_12015 [Planctomycetota bacterium]
MSVRCLTYRWGISDYEETRIFEVCGGLYRGCSGWWVFGRLGWFGALQWQA